MTISEKFFAKNLQVSNISRTFAPAIKQHSVGAIAQLVEQRTENPCVPGSIPGGTTYKKELLIRVTPFFVALTSRCCIDDIAQLVEQRTDISRLSGNLVGISINLCKSIQKELFIYDTP